MNMKDLFTILSLAILPLVKGARGMFHKNGIFPTFHLDAFPLLRNIPLPPSQGGMLIKTLFVCIFLLPSCITEDIPDNTPQGNFEALWKVIATKYCFLDYKHEEYGLDWN